VRGQQLSRGIDTLQRADGQQAIQRYIEVVVVADAASGVNAPQYRMQMRREASRKRVLCV